MLNEARARDSDSTTWWSTVLRGLLAVVFGVLVLSRPAIGAFALVVLFGFFAALDGIMALTTSYHLGRAGMRWGWWLFEGLVGLAVAALAFIWPGVTMLVIVLLVAARAIVLGALEIGAGIAGRMLEHRWLLGIAGLVSVVFGALLVAQPLIGGIALVWAIGVYAIVSGVVLAAAGVRARGASHDMAGRHASPAE